MITAVLVLSLLQSPSNTLTPAERAAGWRLLFDGRTLAGWRGLGYDTVPTAHWVVVNGVIKKIASGDVPRVADGRPLVGGDLMTVDSFADFELTFEWKVTPGANSGVKYNVSEAMSLAQGGAGTQGGPTHSALGFEYQILDDDRHEDGKLPTHRSGAVYDLIATRRSSCTPWVSGTARASCSAATTASTGSTGRKSSNSSSAPRIWIRCSPPASTRRFAASERSAGDTSSCRTTGTKSISAISK